MGLDMYLTKSHYIGAKYDFRNIKGIIDVSDDKGKYPINFNKVMSIREDAMYWRKANAIHQWFVDNVQDGEDNCAEYYVPYEDLVRLRDLCIEVKNDMSKAEEPLPTQDEFFFGSTEYGEWYEADLDYTIEGLTKLIDEYDEYPDHRPEYYYSSSW